MVRFWKDTWCGEVPLCDTFPSLYALAVNKEVLAVDFWELSGVEGGWSPRFSGAFNDWALEEV